MTLPSALCTTAGGSGISEFNAAARMRLGDVLLNCKTRQIRQITVEKAIAISVVSHTNTAARASGYIHIYTHIYIKQEAMVLLQLMSAGFTFNHDARVVTVQHAAEHHWVRTHGSQQQRTI